MDHKDDQMERQSKVVFQKGKGALNAPPFMAARVANEIQLRQGRQNQAGLWRVLAVLGGALSFSLAVALGLVLFSPKFDAHVGQSTLVAIELRPLQTVEGARLARMEVVLPPGVTFVSDKYPELNGTRSVALDLPQKELPREMPFVVRSDVPGVKEITVKVLNPVGEVISSRTIRIRFS